MSRSTFSDPHPIIVVTAAPAPRTFRNSRRFTPPSATTAGLTDSDSMLIRLVVARAAVVSRTERRVRLTDVAVDAPAHVERRCLVNLLHVLDLAVARLARHAGIDVAHVRKMNVLRKLVDADPRHRLLLIPVRGELFDFRLPRRHDCMASHTGPDCRQPWVERFVGGEVAVETVHLKRVHVDRVTERNRLHRTVPL